MTKEICAGFLFCTLIQIVSSQSSIYNFSQDFVFGVSTAAYQIEGAWNEDGKGENIWDHYLHEDPSIVKDKTNGDVACDSYHKWREDVQLIKGVGVNFYRFSIAWSRVLPLGAANTDLNEKGVAYYNNLIDALVAEGIEPYVTMYHWDLPQVLQNKGGWLNDTIIDDFTYYAKMLFQLYGDRVKHWISFNEIAHFCGNGYGSGIDAPFWKNPGVGDYQCAHRTLLAHGKIYRMYEKEFKPSQGGQVGFSIDSGWCEPLEGVDAGISNHYLQFTYAWLINPPLAGDYPQIMKERISTLSKQQGFPKSRLPEFTAEEKEMINGTIDFLGLNHYSTNLCKYDDSFPQPSRESDCSVASTQNPIWVTSAASWDKYAPWGFRKLLIWIKDNYNNPPVLITENGWANSGPHIDDLDRVMYFRGYLAELLNAINEHNCNVIGYSAWSLMDNLEWTSGFSVKFGMIHVDFDSTNRTRTPRRSYYFYKDTISGRRIA